VSADHSLVDFLDAPVVVGDPEGRAVYLNPAFESRFGAAPESALGTPLAELFEGGGREAVLRAVARVCERGESVRFRVRERGMGYAAVVSPIVAEDARVGVVILLFEEVETAERMLALHREIQDPLGELAGSLDAMLEQTGGRRSERYRGLVEDGLRALSRLRKWSDEIGALLAGSPVPTDERFDPAQLVRTVAERLRGRPGEGPEVLVLAAHALPPAAGDAARLETALVRLVEGRMASGPRARQVVLGARRVGSDAEARLLVSLTEHFDDGGAAPPEDLPAVRHALAAVAADLHTVCDPQLGRTTLLVLPAAA